MQNKKENCCGCMACMNVCPVNAIMEQTDENGFIYPVVDYDKCIDCNLCNKVCDWLKTKTETLNILSAYALRYNNKGVLRKSTSGGAFTALAEGIFDKGGYVVGASWNGLDLRHILIRRVEDIDKLRGTKYVQSRIGYIYKEIKTLLDEGKRVMFVGTPCQVAGVKSFLRHPYDNLLLVDFLCHGVPNNDFLKSHIAYIEKLKGRKVCGYLFRDKKFGWNPSGIEGVVYADGKHSFDYEVQSYNKFFHSNVSLRPSCLNCRYRSRYRNSDITIADFWGVEKVLGKQDGKGVSLVFVNTHKGVHELVKIKNCTVTAVPLEEVLYRVSISPSRSKYDVERFWALYREKGYGALVDRYISNAFTSRLRFYLKKCKRRIRY